ncbi:6-phosphogluconolactonase [Pseudomonas sp. RL_15y_Pfl2_60]|uniref:6-phosphogluconolactonase n=1 Tax=Pseudomonas sp. RL_15y_Pfl2_60 TaxID=3088709 RepID=UPI0030DD2CD7
MAISDLQLPAGVVTHSLSNSTQLANKLAADVADALGSAIAEKGRATLVVSGGRSPVAFFEALARQPLQWSSVVVSLADERWVPTTHADSNEGLVRRHLLQGPAAAAQMFGLYSSAASLEAAAVAADQALEDLPPIDVLVLGMGDDGHTASLFPNSPNLLEALAPDAERRCLPMLAPSVPHQRLTMTLALLATAKRTLLAIQGQSKLSTLAQALEPDERALMPVRAFLQPPLEIYWCA